MIPSFILFWGVAAVSVVGALGVVFSPKAVHAVLSLLVAMLGIAVGFFALGSPMLAAMQLIIYAGAVIVLFLFVVMLLDFSDVLPSLTLARGALAVAAGAGVAVFTAALVTLVVGGELPPAATERLTGGADEVGRALYGQHVALILLIGVLLTAAADGVVGLTRSHRS